MCQEKRRIILLSNTEDLGRIIQLSLEEIAGWQVFIANSNYDGLAIIATINPDVILLDTILPDLEGLPILQMIQEYPYAQGIPIIVLTERMLSRDCKLYKSLGVVAAIAKPFDLFNLVTKIKHQLNGNSYR